MTGRPTDNNLRFLTVVLIDNLLYCFFLIGGWG